MANKHSIDTLTRVALWNKKRSLNNFSAKLELLLITEEYLEMLENFFPFIRKVKKLILKLIGFLITENKNKKLTERILSNREIEYNYVDALGDMIVIAAGSIHKVGYDPHAVLHAIMDINDKKGHKKDKNGKIIKTNNIGKPNFEKAKRSK